MEEKEKTSTMFGIDVDEVLAEFMVGLNSYYNLRFGTNFRYEDYIYYDLEKVWGGSKERAIKIVEDFYITKDFFEITPVMGSQEAIKELSTIFLKIVAITSRPVSIREATLFWIRRHYGDSIDDVIFNGQHSLLSSHDLSKLEQCLSNGVRIFVDDYLTIAEKLSKGGVRTYLLTKPWNQKAESNGFIRVENWPQILNDLYLFKLK